MRRNILVRDIDVVGPLDEIYNDVKYGGHISLIVESHVNDNGLLTIALLGDAEHIASLLAWWNFYDGDISDFMKEAIVQ